MIVESIGTDKSDPYERVGLIQSNTPLAVIMGCGTDTIVPTTITVHSNLATSLIADQR